MMLISVILFICVMAIIEPKQEKKATWSIK